MRLRARPVSIPRLHWGVRITSWFLCSLFGCTAYDAALLTTRSDACGDGRVEADEFCDLAISPERPGACPNHCVDTNPCAPKRLIGSGCDRHCVTAPVTAAVDGDGCCLGDLDVSEDSDCGFCGDGIVGPGETCDPPATCQTEQDCRPPNGCIATTYSGSPDDCDALCMPSLLDSCISSDGCCPANCNASNDSDCSDRCGDGRVDEEAGETCEPTNTRAPCPTTCDDGDPCTSDLQLGSPTNCNVACSHTPITAAADGDACCPSGETATTDSDCKSTCNGGVSDSGAACAADAATPQDGAQRCLAILATTDTSASASAACRECGCSACSSVMLPCYASGDSDRDAKCVSAFECTQQNNCFNACYCGSNLLCTNPSGPCTQPFEAAAVTPSATAVGRCSEDQSCPLYWARVYRECLQTYCSRDCYR
jgi:hypothetical protein